MLDSAQNSIQL